MTRVYRLEWGLFIDSKDEQEVSLSDIKGSRKAEVRFSGPDETSEEVWHAAEKAKMEVFFTKNDAFVKNEDLDEAFVALMPIESVAE